MNKLNKIILSAIILFGITVFLLLNIDRNESLNTILVTEKTQSLFSTPSRQLTPSKSSTHTNTPTQTPTNYVSSVQASLTKNKWNAMNATAAAVKPTQTITRIAAEIDLGEIILDEITILELEEILYMQNRLNNEAQELSDEFNHEMERMNSFVQNQVDRSLLNIINFHINGAPDQIEKLIEIGNNMEFYYNYFNQFDNLIQNQITYQFLEKTNDIEYGRNYIFRDLNFVFYDLKETNSESDLKLLQASHMFGSEFDLFLIDSSNNNEIVSYFPSKIYCRDMCFLDVVYFGDITGDSNDEILFTYSRFGTWTTSREFAVISIVEDRYSISDSIIISTFAESEIGYTFDPIKMSVFASYPNSSRGDCTWLEQVELNWFHGIPTLSILESEPETPNCLAETILSIGSVNDFNLVLDNFEQALLLINEETENGLKSFILLHLGILYSIENNQNNAYIAFKEFLKIDGSIQEVLAAELDLLLTSNQASPLKLCDMLREKVIEISIYDSYYSRKIFGWEALNISPSTTNLNSLKDFICNYPSLLNLYTNTLDWEKASRPSNYLQEFGFGDFVISINQTAGGIEDVLIFDPLKPEVYSLEMNNEGNPYWNKVYFHLPEDNGDYSVINFDFYNPNEFLTQVVIGYPLEDPLVMCTKETEQLFEIYIEGIPGKYLEYKDTVSFCIDPEHFENNLINNFEGSIIKFIEENDGTRFSIFNGNTLTRILIGFNNFGEILPDNWKNLLIESNKGYRSITENFLQSKEKQTWIPFLSYFLKSIDGMRYSEQPIANLKYLLAVAFEEKDEYCTAAELYLEIWKTFPDTIWSELAEAKIVFVEDGQGVCSQ